VREPLLEALDIRQMQREQFFIAIELIGHGTLGDLESPAHQFLMNLWDTALLLVPERSHQRDHIQPEFSMWQRPSSFFLRSRGLMKARACRIATPIHLQGQPCHSLQGGHGPVAVMTHAHPTSTRSAGHL
jgi:hypothetical protein